MNYHDNFIAVTLIQEAMRGVRIVPCKRCVGSGEVGLPSLRATCPDCCGCGQSTINELEVGHEPR